MLILAATAFAVSSIVHKPKVSTPGQLVFGQDIILLIKHKVNWKLILHRNQSHIQHDNVRENTSRVDQDCQSGDKFTLITNLV